MKWVDCEVVKHRVFMGQNCLDCERVDACSRKALGEKNPLAEMLSSEVV